MSLVPPTLVRKWIADNDKALEDMLVVINVDGKHLSKDDLVVHMLENAFEVFSSMYEVELAALAEREAQAKHG